MCIRDSLYTVNRLNGWQKGQVSGMELEVNEYSRLEPVKEEIRARVDTCLLYTSAPVDSAFIELLNSLMSL